jgi:hypothetical protein
MKFIRGAILALSLLCLTADATLVGMSGARCFGCTPAGGGGGSSPGDIFFNESYTTPGASNEYGYNSLIISGSGGEGSFEHLASGDYDGSGAAHFTIPANTSEGGGPGHLGHTGIPEWSLGTPIYIRTRFRFDDTSRWTGGNVEYKFGSIGDTADNSRVLWRLTEPNNAEGTPSTFGLSGHTVDSWSDAAHVGKYAFLRIRSNIEPNDLTGPALLTYGNNAASHVPGPNSTAPVSGWYWVQVEIVPGNVGSGSFKLWVNNCTYASPTRSYGPFVDNNGVQSGLWNDLGTTPPALFSDESGTTAQGWRIGHHEVGDTYDAQYCHPASFIVLAFAARRRSRSRGSRGQSPLRKAA